jgi:hypothetical protein
MLGIDVRSNQGLAKAHRRPGTVSGLERPVGVAQVSPYSHDKAECLYADEQQQGKSPDRFQNGEFERGVGSRTCCVESEWVVQHASDGAHKPLTNYHEVAGQPSQQLHVMMRLAARY